MKKALVLLLISITMFLAGILHPAGTSVSAEVVITQPVISAVTKTSSGGTFFINAADVKSVIVEYVFESNGTVFSKLGTLDATLISQNLTTSTYQYRFTLPAGATSFKIWRIISQDDHIRSVTGSNLHGSLEDVQVRLKTIYVKEDLITREKIGARDMATGYAKFTMHFNLEDDLGDPIPIDRIHSIDVEYVVISTTFGIVIKNEESKTIVATESRNQVVIPVWPHIIPASVTQHIKFSTVAGYRWQVNLGTFTYTMFFGDVTLDKTQLMEIDYYYDGYFFQDQEIIDEPYDWEDIVDIVPETPEGIFYDIIAWIMDNPWTAISIGVGIILLSLVAKALSILGVVFQVLKEVLRFVFLIIKYIILAIWWILRKIATVLWWILKLLLIGIPKGIIKFIWIMLVPADKRRVSGKDIIYVNRSL